MPWQVNPKNKSVKQELEILPDFSILRLVNIDVRKNQRIIINNFELINDNVKENVAKTKLVEITRGFLANVQQEKIISDDPKIITPDTDSPNADHLSPAKTRGIFKKQQPEKSVFKCVTCNKVYKRQYNYNNHFKKCGKLS